MALSPEVDIFLRTIYVVLIVVNIVGNVLVCLIVRRFPFMKTPMNYLLVHLAICDMLLGIFLFPKLVLLELYEHPSGAFGDFLCKFVTSGHLGWLSSCGSVYTLVAVAWERHKAIIKPHAPRFSNKQVKLTIVMSWVVAFFICLPESIALKYNPQIKLCDLFWIGRWSSLLDSTIWLFAIGILPPLIMTVLYSKVICALWCSRKKNEDVSQRSLMKSRKRITKTAIIVTVILFACWMPNLIHYVIVTFVSQEASNFKQFLANASPIIYPVSLALILLNSSINPFIYALQSIRFRTCMKSLLCGWCTQQKTNKENTASAYTIQIKEGNNGLAQKE